MPTWTTVLPNLEILDISHNPKLRYLPVKLLKTMPRLSTVRCRWTIPAYNDRDGLPDIRSVPAAVRSRRMPTLAECAVHAFLRSREQEHEYARGDQDLTDAQEQVDLPPQMLRLVQQSYICDICESAQYPPLTKVDRTNWVEGNWHLLQVSMSGRDDNGQPNRIVPFEGRICLRCVHRDDPPWPSSIQGISVYQPA